MQNVTENVFTDTTIRGCNPSFVVTVGVKSHEFSQRAK